MMTDGEHQETPQEEKDGALWRLLGRAPQPGPVSPYFARRVLREVAALEEDHPPTQNAPSWLARRWRALFRPPGAAFACALVAAVLTVVGGTQLATMRQPAPTTPVDAGGTVASETVATDRLGPSPTVALSSEPVVTAQDVEVIADLDNVLSREESRLWTEDDTARF